MGLVIHHKKLIWKMKKKCAKPLDVGEKNSSHLQIKEATACGCQSPTYDNSNIATFTLQAQVVQIWFYFAFLWLRSVLFMTVWIWSSNLGYFHVWSEVRHGCRFSPTKHAHITFTLLFVNCQEWWKNPNIEDHRTYKWETGGCKLNRYMERCFS